MLRINRVKLARFLKEKREKELKMTQRRFVEYVKEVYGEELSYATISKLEKLNNENDPALHTIYVLAQLAGVGIDEFIEFLQSPDHVSISDVASYKQSKKELDANPDKFLELFKQLSSDVKLSVYGLISDQIVSEAQEAFKLKALIKSMKGLES